MQPTLGLIVTFVALAVANSGFTIPKGMKDGIYIVNYENGVASHTKFADAGGIEKREPLRRKIRKFRQMTPFRPAYFAPVIACRTNAHLDESGIVESNKLLDNICGGNILPYGKFFYAKRNGVVAFVCNHGGNDSRCDPLARLQSTNQIMQQCGRDQPGAVTLQNQLIYGYDNERATYCSVTTEQEI